jgi:hypothetical protein
MAGGTAEGTGPGLAANAGIAKANASVAAPGKDLFMVTFSVGVGSKKTGARFRRIYCWRLEGGPCQL